MKIIHRACDLTETGGKVCLAIGVFDGVHLGHQQVVRQTIFDANQIGASSVAITFDRHPSAVVAPARTVPLIYSLSQKLRVIDSLGVDATFLIRFDRTFSEQSGEVFIRGLARDFGRIHSVCVGSNFTFGHKRTGNVTLLKQLGQELKFHLHALAAVALDGKVVSSTRIRESLRNGNLNAVSQMLGRPYVLSGAVVAGDRLGQKLGFPTANLDVAGLVLPPLGVYAVRALVRGRSFRAVLNLGHRPTLANPTPQLRAEAHLLDFSEEIYGEELALTLVEKLRDEERFPSLEALRDQIARDILQARALLGSAG